MQAFEVQGGGGCLAVGFGAVFVVPGAEGLVAGFTERESRVESGLDACGAPGAGAKYDTNGRVCTSYGSVRIHPRTRSMRWPSATARSGDKSESRPMLPEMGDSRITLED